MKHVIVSLMALAVLLCAPPQAAAEEVKVLLCFPGGPGSTEDAQPIVDRFLGRVATLAGWAKASGTYCNDMTACQQAREDGAPQAVILPLDVYLANRARWNLTPVAALQNKEITGRYHVIVQKGKTLEAVKGQTLITSLKSAASFLSRVAFEGKISVETDFQFSRVRSPIRAIRNVVDGKAAAAILDDNQRRSLDGLPMAAEITVALSGRELPGAIVAGVGGVPTNLAAALTAVCAQHARECEEMRITGFAAVDAAQLTELEQQLSQ